MNKCCLEVGRRFLRTRGTTVWNSSKCKAWERGSPKWFQEGVFHLRENLRNVPIWNRQGLEWLKVPSSLVCPHLFSGASQGLPCSHFPPLSENHDTTFSLDDWLLHSSHSHCLLLPLGFVFWGASTGSSDTCRLRNFMVQPELHHTALGVANQGSPQEVWQQQDQIRLKIPAEQKKLNWDERAACLLLLF